MQMPGWFPEYATMTGLTALGALMRGSRWLDPVTGKFVPAKFVTEAATAAGLAVIAIGAGTAWNIEPPAMSAICVGVGWLGPDAAWAILRPRLGVKGGPDAT